MDFGVISLVGTIDDGDSRGLLRGTFVGVQGRVGRKGARRRCYFSLRLAGFVRCAGGRKLSSAPKDSRNGENWVLAGDFV